VEEFAEKLPGRRRNVTSPAGHVVQVDGIPWWTALQSPMLQNTTPKLVKGFVTATIVLTNITL